VQENTSETHEWLKKYYKHTKSVKPDAFSVGEVWSSTEVVSSYIGDELDSCFEFDVSYATIDAINNADAKRLNDAVTKAWGMIPRNQYSSFLSNHDQTRVATRFGGDAAKSKLGAALLLTLPGIPFMYYGEELGMTGDKPDENLRTPMQWSNQINAGFTTATPWRAPNQGYQRQNVAGQARDPNSILSTYRNMIRLRLANPALADGDFAAVETSDNKVLAFLRSPATTARGDASFLIVANLSSEPIKGAKLSMKESPLRRAKMRDAWDEKIEFTAPKLSTRGGFEGFVPVEELAPRSVTIIKVLN
jgi:glycosidase